MNIMEHAAWRKQTSDRWKAAPKKYRPFGINGVPKCTFVPSKNTIDYYFSHSEYYFTEVLPLGNLIIGKDEISKQIACRTYDGNEILVGMEELHMVGREPFARIVPQCSLFGVETRRDTQLQYDMLILPAAFSDGIFFNVVSKGSANMRTYSINEMMENDIAVTLHTGAIANGKEYRAETEHGTLPQYAIAVAKLFGMTTNGGK